ISSTTTGPTSSVQVLASSTADDEFGLDNALHVGASGAAVDTLQVDAKWDGAFGNDLTLTVSAATSGDADEFKLQVLSGAIIVETHDNLSMTDTDDNFVETVINHPTTGSVWIAVVDLDAAVSSPGDLPATGTFGPLTGGDDGLTGLADTDFVGGEGPNGKVGLRTFDPDSDIDVLIVPDRATSTVHNAMITYADITREGLIFAVLDPPAGLDTQGMATYVKTTAALFNATENAAIYWPRVKVSNPNKPIYGNDDLLVVPPSGHITGVYARTDASKVGGVFEQPAGTDNPFLPRGIEGFENDEVLDIANREILFPLNINPISREEGTQIFIDGARNLDITGNWPSVGQRRGVMFVE
ncbi:MAG: phage tail sheath subtilisin-like domain-containing protein, partial [Gammaproteobacteria bacterium]|nr:phage tail sheath subtilisin-like domain-containing protein [Gammaproteobacteria bacterium]